MCPGSRSRPMRMMTPSTAMDPRTPATATFTHRARPVAPKPSTSMLLRSTRLRRRSPATRVPLLSTRNSLVACAPHPGFHLSKTLSDARPRGPLQVRGLSVVVLAQRVVFAVAVGAARAAIKIRRVLCNNGRLSGLFVDVVLFLLLCVVLCVQRFRLPSDAGLSHRLNNIPLSSCVVGSAMFSSHCHLRVHLLACGLPKGSFEALHLPACHCTISASECCLCLQCQITGRCLV